MKSALYESYQTDLRNEERNMQLRVFNNSEFGQIRTLNVNNEPWFVGKDVAEILGYANQNRDILRHTDEEDRIMVDGTQYRNGIEFDYKQIGQRGGWLINESGLYSLILSSKLPSAKKFKRWVTSEVLPAIRKHGAYMTTDVIEETLSNPDFIIQLASKLKDEQQQRKLAEEENIKLSKVIELQKPKVDYVDEILSCNNALLVTNIAQDYGLSAKALNKILQDERVQRNVRGQWILYADYQGKGYIKTETKMIGDKPRVQTLWTQKGRMLIHQILTKRNIKPLEDMAI